ncbi:ATP-dependent protease La [Pseudovirgaria hyperparasitica]|uniref:Lon protease homolog, mitochondrial n=1 Tax=Pseudovirgaria hyperparasitica TaxID=470096 RepID=A0A6A6WL27_9PEZI|nr:ATP-dependent protease La [Pseudovirgaria hyperparasitica]KAF2762905.1 ATP-dependent protease La [Pseudovirgaria hyperparasitica]
MLYGQNLPWRLALQHSSRQRLSVTRRHITAQSVCAYNRSPFTRRPEPSHPSYPLPRPFSSSPFRPKEQPSKPSLDQDAAKDKELESQEDNKLAGSPEAAEAKSKTPDPLPSNKSSDGRGAASGSSGDSGSTSGGDGGGGGKRRKGQGERNLTKPTIPEVYPRVMCVPINQRPLFPGFYKAITIKDKEVAAAITEMVNRGQQYIGAFLLKDDKADTDTIKSMDEVYDVGTFCQITSAFPVQGDVPSMTCVLYPHRRIKMTSMVQPGPGSGKEGSPLAEAVVEEIPAESTEAKETAETNEPKESKDSKDGQSKKGDVVASFEESMPEKSKQGPQYDPTSFLQERPVSIVGVENLVDEPYDSKNPTVRALVTEIMDTCKDMAQNNALFRDHISTLALSHSSGSPGNFGEDAARMADFAAAVARSDETKELQDVLASTDIEDRLHKALVVLKKELLNNRLQREIHKEVEEKIAKNQREYYLMQQYKAIRRELGLEADGKDKIVEKFKTKAEKLAMPEAVKKVFDEEINKLAHLEPAASEFNVTRNYLDWLTQIPWGQRSAEKFGIKHARAVLDEDHHGLKDVKDRILEFIAVGKLRGTVEGKILCMVGPPGVGKTSIGKSIARALNRQYYRFSVGGLTDVAEIKGHRRTYVGALPGRMIQALKKCQTENPLVLIDEVDKIGRGHQGDPASALLELLDPEQNSSFLDHYMDVPIDLSKVLFVCTANMTDTIPRPLLDRMEMIELSGYVADEKIAIAERYLAPQAKEMSGLKDVNVNLEPDAIVELINKYCRESGVRNLKKQIEKVYRKSALKIIEDFGDEHEALAEEKALTDEGKAAQEQSDKDQTDTTVTSENIENETTEKPRKALQVPDTVNVSITKDNLSDYVGPPVYTADRLYDVTPAGVAMGLAWTQMGGAALYIESILEAPLSKDSRASLERTGNLKPVMKESTSIAYSFAKSVMARRFSDNKFLQHAQIHLHCPEGAVPKDGPSAGITMATSLLSLALNKPLKPTIAMTGELTVTGKVLRIGGLREKTVAARRAGCDTVIFPQDNLSDWLELPENIRDGIEGKPVSWYDEVFEVVFPDVDSSAVGQLWKKELAGAGKRGSRSAKRGTRDDDEDSDDDD